MTIGDRPAPRLRYNPSVRPRISPDELSKISYLDGSDLQGRMIPLIPVWDGTVWTLWLHDGQEGLFEVHPHDTVNTKYVAHHPAKQTDLFIEFIDFLSRHACWSDLVHWQNAIETDIHNLGSSLAKLEHFWASRERLGQGIGRFVATEFEYIIFVCRSIFDLIQELLSRIWDKVKLLDAATKKTSMRKTFAGMVLQANDLLTSDEIARRHCLPESLATAYGSLGAFFQRLRDYRDSLVHTGKEVSTIFTLDQGFAVEREREELAAFGVWRDDDVVNDRLVPLRVLVVHIILSTILGCNTLIATISRIIEFPGDCFPGYRVFLRGEHTDALFRAATALDDPVSRWQWGSGSGSKESEGTDANPEATKDGAV